MIIPNPWLTNLLQTSVRRFVVQKARIHSIVHFKFPVFPKVVVDTEILILEKTKFDRWDVDVSVVDKIEFFLSPVLKANIRHIKHSQQEWRKLDGDVINIFLTQAEKKLAAKCKKLGARLDSFCAINVGVKPYQVGKGTPAQTRKIFMRQTGDRFVAALDRKQRLCLNNMHALVPTNEKVSTSFLLGLINSTLLNWYYRTLNPEVGEALAEVKRANVAKLPIHVGRTRHDRVVELVERMIELQKERNAAKTDHTKTNVRRQIDATESQIDKLVYDLYDLTAAEIKIPEAAK